MFLAVEVAEAEDGSFPHVGGDVSFTRSSAAGFALFSPRRWGCFWNPPKSISASAVFPMQVGMFPWKDECSPGLPGFPHAGGDVFESVMRGCCW